MTILRIEQTDQGTVVTLHDRIEIAGMHMTADALDKRKLCLEIKDSGEATMEMVLAVFKNARAMGELPIIE